MTKQICRFSWDTFLRLNFKHSYYLRSLLHLKIFLIVKADSFPWSPPKQWTTIFLPVTYSPYLKQPFVTVEKLSHKWKFKYNYVYHVLLECWHFRVMNDVCKEIGQHLINDLLFFTQTVFEIVKKLAKLIKKSIIY